MKSIRVQNLRSLRDTGFIDLKPITVLLGSNSSGKSTFLRVLPLCHQSAEARTVGPVLWNGRFTDFGSFEEAVSLGREEISLHFCYTQLAGKPEDQRVFFMRGGDQSISCQILSSGPIPQSFLIKEKTTP
jgi:predicted ATPase